MTYRLLRHIVRSARTGDPDSDFPKRIASAGFDVTGRSALDVFGPATVCRFRDVFRIYPLREPVSA